MRKHVFTLPHHAKACIYLAQAWLDLAEPCKKHAFTLAKHALTSPDRAKAWHPFVPRLALRRPFEVPMLVCTSIGGTPVCLGLHYAAPFDASQCWCAPALEHPFVPRLALRCPFEASQCWCAPGSAGSAFCACQSQP